MASAGKKFNLTAVVALALIIVSAGCNFNSANTTSAGSADRIQVILFNDVLTPTALNGELKLRAARNETAHFALRLNRIPPNDKNRSLSIRLSPLKGSSNAIIATSAFSASQVLSMPVDTHRAGFVRHTGLAAADAKLPRALLPLAMNDGTVPAGSLRNADDPFNPGGLAGNSSDGSAILWIDVQVPPTVAPGEYQGAIELLEDGKSAAMLPVLLRVEEFVLSDERRLAILGRMEWAQLASLFPKELSGAAPARLNRGDAQSVKAIAQLDKLVKLAQSHRVQVYIPELAPVVKWPSGRPPQLDWIDFDSVASPWLRGDAFADRVPLAHWPLPPAEQLERADAPARAEYWRLAASHFDTFDWLLRSSVMIEKSTPGRATLEESIELSRLAAGVLNAHPRLRVTVPLEEEQVQLATTQYPGRIPPESLGRLTYAAPGMVSASPMQRLPENAGARILRTDMPGLLPQIGAGVDEHEARLWAWLAFVRDARMAHWNSVLPRVGAGGAATPGESAAFDELVWFYPGTWFGVSDPVPTLQLKWLRRAEEDYEYLFLAKQRGQGARAMSLARLLCRPVEIQPAQRADAVYALMSGTSENAAWEGALDLLAGAIQVARPGQAADPAAERMLDTNMTTWLSARERPMLLVRSVQWSPAAGAQGRRYASARIGVDIYNAAQRQPEKNTLQFGALPEALDAPPMGIEVAKLGTMRVDRFFLDARVTLDSVNAGSRQPLRVTFIDGFNQKMHAVQAVLPVAWSERRQGALPRVDGTLSDWQREDALHDGKLVAMLSRPAIQKQELRYAVSPSAVYSTWSSGHFFVAFNVGGVEKAPAGAGRNFVEYDLRRAWAEDICETLIQPIYEDGSAGPLLHVAVKPGGQADLSRRLDPRLNANPWQPFAGADVRYAATVDNGTWRGEMSIPWDAINDLPHAGKRPVMLRFNFTQHMRLTGQSATWAGPVDFGRDEELMGLIDIREADVVGRP